MGTTLVEAYSRGHNVIGFEINPYAVLAAQVKLRSRRISISKFSNCVEAFETFMESRCSNNGRPKSKPPEGFSGRHQLFSEAVEQKVLYVLDFVDSITDPTLRDFSYCFGFGNGKCFELFL